MYHRTLLTTELRKRAFVGLVGNLCIRKWCE